MHLTGHERKESSLRRPVQAADRRRHRRVPWVTRVRGIGPDGEEFQANTVDVGAGGLRINLARPYSVGDVLVLYLDDLGRVEGPITRVLPDFGYAIEFAVPPRKRDKIADQLTWLINKDRLQLLEDRVAERRTSGGQVVVQYGEGVTIACAVVDMSVFGIAFRTNGPRPMIGDQVRVGDRTGACVRYIEGGFAIDFRAPDTGESA
ncbi:MAG: PilZ domain-containing protein [Hyphomonadaceae bacterium]